VYSFLTFALFFFFSNATHKNSIVLSPDVSACSHFAMKTDGHTYERREIEAWLQRSSISPLTGLVLDGPDAKDLEPNRALRAAISKWRTEQEPKAK
jgi:hypothetical protein